MIGPPEMIVAGLVGLLVFGNKLPQVGRSLGKSIVEFKKGVKGVKEEIDEEMNKAESEPSSDPEPTPEKKEEL
ncbi:MAG: twin-arginine translocase TatA/TatE family subunit [Phycisphaerae bacterium]|nr:twin-arginine translocase TatA/TatE family subunit [Phycisphaerae bacterium]